MATASAIRVRRFLRLCKSVISRDVFFLGLVLFVVRWRSWYAFTLSKQVFAIIYYYLLVIVNREELNHDSLQRRSCNGKVVSNTEIKNWMRSCSALVLYRRGFATASLWLVIAYGHVVAITLVATALVGAALKATPTASLWLVIARYRLLYHRID